MTTLASTETQLLERIDEIGAKIHDVREATAATIFGQERVIDLALITLLSGGHALLIGVPGLAKGTQHALFVSTCHLERAPDSSYVTLDPAQETATEDETLL